MFTDLLS